MEAGAPVGAALGGHPEQRHGVGRAPSRPRIVSGLLLAGLGAWLLLIFLPGRKPLTEPERVRISRQAGVDEHAWRFPPPLYQASQGAAALYVSLGFLISVRGLFFRRRVELSCKRCQRVVMAERGALLMRCESGGHSAGINWGALMLQLAVLVVTLSLIALVVMAQLEDRSSASASTSVDDAPGSRGYNVGMRRWILSSVLALAAASSACGRDTAKAVAVPPDEAADLLINRNWLDRWPTGEKERLHVYRFTPSMGGGVYQDRTLFAGKFELFTYQLDGDHLTIQWPDSKEEDRMVYRIDRVSGPEPFDLRLELSTPSRGPRTYYGRTAETGGAEAGQRQLAVVARAPVTGRAPTPHPIPYQGSKRRLAAAILAHAPSGVRRLIEPFAGSAAISLAAAARDLAAALLPRRSPDRAGPPVARHHRSSGRHRRRLRATVAGAAR